MRKRNRRKMGIALILFVAAFMLMRLAYATVAQSVSVWLIGAGVLLMLAALTVFALYFKE